MKQKVVAKAIIKEDDKILLLRRKGGRPSIAGLYELPGSTVHIGQQPEDALRQGLRTYLDVSAETTQIEDALSFIDPDDRLLQYVFIVFRASLKPTDRTITLNHEYDRYVWKKMSDIQHNEITQSTQQILGLRRARYIQEVVDSSDNNISDLKTTNTYAVAYCDGGSRGNPGPSAAGYVLLDEHGAVVAEGGAYLGIATNNFAEYQAVYLALERALELGIRTIDFRLDSQLVVNQMNGVYKIKSDDLREVNVRIHNVMRHFDRVTYTHVRRQYNQLADGVVNKILDANQQQDTV